MKTRQLASIHYKGREYKVIYSYTQKTNPFTIYMIWNELTDHGCVKRKQRVINFAEYGSCIWFMGNLILKNNIERPEG